MDRRVLLVNTKRVDVLRTTLPTSKPPDGDRRRPLNEATPEHLRDAASYAEALAEHKEREARLEEEADDTDVKERPLMTSRTTSQPKQRSRSRRSTTIGTTTGSGGKEIR